MRRGLKREDLIEDPAELVALPNMVPVYAVIRPHALMCFIVLGILGTLVIGGAYDVIFWSAGSRNVLTDTVLGPEVLQGEPAQIVFGNDTEPLSPYMRWLRVSMVLYPKAREEAGCGLYNMTERCRMPVPSNLVLRSAILYRQADDEPWRLSKKSSDAELDPIECPKRTSKTSHPHHPGWPDGSRDPLDRGHHSHCYVFSVAYEPGLEHKQFAAQLTLATQPGKDSPADYPPPSEWIDSIVLVSTHGTIEHGYSELCLRLLALVTSLVSFGLFTRQLWRHPLRDWLPQQYAIWIFSLAICGCVRARVRACVRACASAWASAPAPRECTDLRWMGSRGRGGLLSVDAAVLRDASGRRRGVRTTRPEERARALSASSAVPHVVWARG